MHFNAISKVTENHRNKVAEIYSLLKAHSGLDLYTFVVWENTVVVDIAFSRAQGWNFSRLFRREKPCSRVQFFY